MIMGENRWTVQTKKIVRYEIIGQKDLFNFSNTEILFPNKREHNHRFVVIDENVNSEYGKRIQDYFEHHGIVSRFCVVESGEAHKTTSQYFRIANELENFPIHRRDEPIIAIGGGVLTDVAAFVAGTYRRGVPHIKIPTTLMGYVDAAIGIKNGINFNEHKNRLGGFEPPLKVFLDRAFLRSLPKRHILNGAAEIIKIGLIKDEVLFNKLEICGHTCVDDHFQNEKGKDLLDLAISDMLEELEPNLYEDELARKVDFGHTFSYGLETRHESHLLHGEAVLLDMLLSVQMSKFRGFMHNSDVERVMRLVNSLGYKLDYSLLETEFLFESLNERVYHRNGFQRVPLPNGIGNCQFVNDISREEIDLARVELSHHRAFDYA